MRKGLRKGISRILILSMLLVMCFSQTVFAAPKTGKWRKNKVGWWYSYSDGTYAKNKWLKINGVWYYFLPSGYMEESGYRDGYYIGKNGAMSTKYFGGKWKKDSRGWWYTDRTGWYPKNQWLKINGKQYFFDAKGYLIMNQWINGKCVNKNGELVPNASTDWAKAYKEYMEEHYTKYAEGKDRFSFENLSFDLIYVDNDSTPELLARYIDGGEYADIISYRNGKIYEINYLGHDGKVMYQDHKHLLLVDSGRQGVYQTQIFRIEKGVPVLLGTGTHLENPDGTKEFTWNDKNVTEKEFNEHVGALFDLKTAQDIKFTVYLSYNEMEDELDGFIN